MADKLKVNMISESAFTVQGQGVHTAFVENWHSLERAGADVVPNTNRRADIIHIHTIGPYSLYKLLFGRGKRIVSAHVTPDSFVGSLRGAKVWYPLARAYLRWYYNRADGVLAVSQEVVEELDRMGVKSPVHLVPNTIDTSFFRGSASKAQLREQLGLPAGAFIVVGSGQVQPRKRADLFASLARQLPQVHFIWAGGIPFGAIADKQAEMKQLMATQLPNLKFTGIIERKVVAQYFQAADLFFLPSVQETFGLVIVEAAAAGLPVLLRDLPQYRVTFQDWYEHGDDTSFGRLIEKFAADHAYYQQWQAKAAQIAQAYDAKAGAQRLLEVYRQTLLG